MLHIRFIFFLYKEIFFSFFQFAVSLLRAPSLTGCYSLFSLINLAVRSLNVKLSPRIKPAQITYQYAAITINVSLVIMSTIFRKQISNTN